MKVKAECYPCFFQQIVKTVRMVSKDETLLRSILVEFGAGLSKPRPEATPAEIGQAAYALVSKRTGVRDPYASLKERSIRQALRLYPKLKGYVASSRDRLKAAVKVAAAGNVIDYGVRGSTPRLPGLEAMLSRRFRIDDYREFVRALDRAGAILYIADNAGETVFDRVLIEEMAKPVVYAVRSSPIINDATAEDAALSGIGPPVRILSSGCAAPGTILDLCSEAFLRAFRSSGLVISKGQGNYEGLSEYRKSRPPVFFLLKAKCAVIAQDLRIDEGDLVLLRNRISE